MRKKLTPIPKRLKEAREKAGLSQKQLGIKAGIDEFSASARMNQYETGKHIPDYFTLSRIAKFLKVPTAYFYADDELLANVIRAYQSANKQELQKLQKLLMSIDQ